MSFAAWTDTVEGPELQGLLHRLAECPADFLAEPTLGPGGEVEVAAVVSDLLGELGGTPLKSAGPFGQVRPDETPAQARNRLRTVLVACWVLFDPWFQAHRAGARAASFLAEGLDGVAGLVQADRLVSDPDRREELVRTCLFGLGLRPSGESVEQAQDRLTTLSSAERARVGQETRAAEARARKIREALERKRAEEAAAAYGGE